MSGPTTRGLTSCLFALLYKVRTGHPSPRPVEAAPSASIMKIHSLAWLALVGFASDLPNSAAHITSRAVDDEWEVSTESGGTWTVKVVEQRYVQRHQSGTETLPHGLCQLTVSSAIVSNGLQGGYDSEETSSLYNVWASTIDQAPDTSHIKPSGGDIFTDQGYTLSAELVTSDPAYTIGSFDRQDWKDAANEFLAQLLEQDAPDLFRAEARSARENGALIASFRFYLEAPVVITPHK